ncbi:hypothetical protein [Fictibacillus sp. S7]|uniref:hypothetical protein n=1 Tax=Fictibacillus sp. S7 TaxID=2212476 RepID=UPI0010132075|nr:hypothetical protein [Fictibacillus sp. S7]RXZ00948.1 hypothetical protein DMO16_15560 [Fictibacillus sp. S7]
MVQFSKMEQKELFIEYRAREIPYEQIAKEIGVSKPTLLKWGRELEVEIGNCRAMELELLQEKYFVSKRTRIELYGKQLNRLSTELDKRDFSGLSTEKLIELQMKIISNLKQEETPIHLKEKRSIEDTLFSDLDTSVVEWRA